MNIASLLRVKLTRPALEIVKSALKLIPIPNLSLVADRLIIIVDRVKVSDGFTSTLSRKCP